MIQCKGCIFFDEYMNNLRLSHNDQNNELEELDEEHYICVHYEEGIPKNIIKDEVNCEYRVEAS